MKKFKSSYSKGMLLSTCLLLVILAFAVYVAMDQLVNLPMGSLNFMGIAIVLCFVLGTILYAFASQIMYVCLTDKEVIIKKRIGQIVIPRNDIVEVSHKRTLGADLRVWGISGLFGHLGYFWNKDTGRYLAYVKDGNSLLEIKTKGKCYVVSCDDYNQVLNALG